VSQTVRARRFVASAEASISLVLAAAAVLLTACASSSARQRSP
jgi:hypothetical protein